MRNPSENNDIPEEPEKLKFAPVIIWILLLSFLIDIIDNIVYASGHQNSIQWQCSIIVMCLRLYHVTSILHCHLTESWSRDTDVYLTYILFGIILTQFYVNFSRQEHQIDVLKVSFNSWDSQVSAYTSFHFSFTVPLNKNLRQIGQWFHELWSNIQTNRDSNRDTPGFPQKNSAHSV